MARWLDRLGGTGLRSPHARATARSLASHLQPVLNAIALLWLLFVAGSYLLLAWLPVTEKTDGAPSPLDNLDGHAVALLAVVLLAGIIKCLGGRGRLRSRAVVEGARDAAPDN
jgi:hypothetical protein